MTNSDSREPHAAKLGCLKAGASYGAFDKSSGLLCGTSLNDLGISAQPPNDDHPFSQNMKQLVELYKADGLREYIASRGTKNYMEIGSLCVKDGYARRGIAKRLCEMSIETAKEKACEYVVIVCLSAYTRKIADRLGLKLIREVLYKDYVDPLTGQMVMKDIPEPHHSVTLHSLDL